MYLKLANEFSNVHINAVPFNGGSDRRSTEPLQFSCDEIFHSSYRFHFECGENARKRPRVPLR